MRPYKAKKKGTDIWLYGWYTYDDRTDTHFLYVYDKDNNVSHKYIIDPSTVCQQIGLPDNEGNEIYDKQIMESIQYTFAVIWNNEESIYELHRNNGTALADARDMELNRCESIGNTIDNPDFFGSKE
ncbi:hypothetical protein LCGC14_0342430 [marine sediment metagenome]|uniref:YopX protein domain-containing protein n=1 Tax=marine sediment metagenome TaxID=412755 RepID=A0A0F9W0N7_9ZZZZ